MNPWLSLFALSSFRNRSLFYTSIFFFFCTLPWPSPIRNDYIVTPIDVLGMILQNRAASIVNRKADYIISTKIIIPYGIQHRSTINLGILIISQIYTQIIIQKNLDSIFFLLIYRFNLLPTARSYCEVSTQLFINFYIVIVWACLLLSNPAVRNRSVIFVIALVNSAFLTGPGQRCCFSARREDKSWPL